METSNLGSPPYKFRDFRNAELQSLQEPVCFHLTFTTRVQPIRMPTKRKEGSPKVSSPQLALSSDRCALSPKRVLSLFTSHTHGTDRYCLIFLDLQPPQILVNFHYLLALWCPEVMCVCVCVCTHICIHVCVYVHMCMCVCIYICPWWLRQ